MYDFHRKLDLVSLTSETQILIFCNVLVPGAETPFAGLEIFEAFPLSLRFPILGSRSCFQLLLNLPTLSWKKCPLGTFHFQEKLIRRSLTPKLCNLEFQILSDLRIFNIVVNFWRIHTVPDCWQPGKVKQGA